MYNLIFMCVILVFQSCGKSIKSGEIYSPSKEELQEDTDRDGTPDLEEQDRGADPRRSPFPIESFNRNINIHFKIQTFAWPSEKYVEFDFKNLTASRIWREKIIQYDWRKRKNEKENLVLDLHPSYMIDLGQNIQEMSRLKTWRRNDHAILDSYKSEFNINFESKNEWVVKFGTTEILLNIKGINFVSGRELYKFIKNEDYVIVEPSASAKKFWSDTMKKCYRLILSDKDGESVYFLNPDISPYQYIPANWETINLNTHPQAGDTIIAYQVESNEKSQLLTHHFSLKGNLLDETSFKNVKIKTYHPVKVELEIDSLIEYTFKTREEIQHIEHNRGGREGGGYTTYCKYYYRSKDGEKSNTQAMISYQWIDNIHFQNKKIPSLNVIDISDYVQTKKTRFVSFWVNNLEDINHIKIIGLENLSEILGTYKTECRTSRPISNQKSKIYKNFPFQMRLSYLPTSSPN